MSRKIAIPGYRIKDGRVVKDERRLDVSTRLKQRGSKRVRVVRPVARSEGSGAGGEDGGERTGACWGTREKVRKIS